MKITGKLPESPVKYEQGYKVIVPLDMIIKVAKKVWGWLKKKKSKYPL